MRDAHHLLRQSHPKAWRPQIPAAGAMQQGIHLCNKWAVTYTQFISKTQFRYEWFLRIVWKCWFSHSSLKVENYWCSDGNLWYSPACFLKFLESPATIIVKLEIKLDNTEIWENNRTTYLLGILQDLKGVIHNILKFSVIPPEGPQGPLSSNFQLSPHETSILYNACIILY